MHYMKQENGKMVEELKIHRRQSMRSQIAEYLREAILRGQIEAGSTLPSTKALSEKWGTQTANVHAALTLLVQEGLLTRMNGVGTIVNSRKTELKTVLVYLGAPADATSSFGRQLLVCLKKELEARNIQWRVIDKGQSPNAFEQVRELVDKGLAQGGILPSTLLKERLAFEALPVPFSCITTARVKNRVSLNFKSLADKAVEGLLRQGCKSAGLLLSLEHDEEEETGAVERRGFVDYLRRKMLDSGITVRDEWVHAMTKADKHISLGLDNYAYEGFRAIWCAEEKPDGLFVYTDEMIPGTLISILSQGIKVPGELKLVLHRNSGCHVLCPVECCFVESDVGEMAAGLVKLLVDQYHGREICQVDIDYKLVRNNLTQGGNCENRQIRN